MAWRKVRLFPIVFAVAAACGGHGPITNLPLLWRGVEALPQPSPAVARSFATAPFAFGLRDVRPDPSVVGAFEEDGFVVRTRDNVAEYCSAKLGGILAYGGARLHEAPTAVLETDLLDYRVDEGSTFKGVVRIRAVLRREGSEAWSRTFVGHSKRWGRTHNPENFNEALSAALAAVAAQLVQDDDFARALVGEAPPVPPLSDPPPPLSPTGSPG